MCTSLVIALFISTVIPRTMILVSYIPAHIYVCTPPYVPLGVSNVYLFSDSPLWASHRKAPNRPTQNRQTVSTGPTAPRGRSPPGARPPNQRWPLARKGWPGCPSRWTPLASEAAGRAARSANPPRQRAAGRDCGRHWGCRPPSVFVLERAT